VSSQEARLRCCSAYNRAPFPFQGNEIVIDIQNTQFCPAYNKELSAAAKGDHEVVKHPHVAFAGGRGAHEVND
jgi:hypothetical protein